jgi:o-succinylbenzoate synthase
VAEDLYVARYVLQLRGAANSRAAGLARQGALVLAGDGVGCVQPWPELGQAGLDEELAGLADGRPGRLGRAALAFARADGKARRAGRWLFDGVEVPSSHYSWCGGLGDDENIRLCLVGGHGSVKLKAGRDLAAARAQLVRLAQLLPGMALRIDFNGVLEEGEFLTWWRGLPEGVRSAVDLVEDPVGGGAEVWARLGSEVPLALDQAWGEGAVGRGTSGEGEGEAKGESEGVRARVLKPSWGDRPRGGGLPLVVTSGMDHAVGMACAAWSAGLWKRRRVVWECGLATGHLYEGGGWFEGVQVGEGVVSFPGRQGLGFEEELAGVAWRRLG